MNTVRVRNLIIDPLPRVVGTVSELSALRSLAAGAPCVSDLVEVRFDCLQGDLSEILELAAQIDAHTAPVLFTVRLECEGGQWSAPDEDRLSIFEAALERISLIDVELQSSLSQELIHRAVDRQKGVISSYHDFAATPGLADLSGSVDRMFAQGSVIAKVATMIRTAADVEILRDLLARPWPGPVCAIGMGPLGEASRVVLAATAGSSLAYGYLDASCAPGQSSAVSLVDALRRLHPGYDADRRDRRS